MAVYTAQSVQKHLSERQGKTVFYLAAGDHLTPSARDWLQKEGIAICMKPADKPEDMTHLRAEELVPKTHPVIAFRGMLDLLQAEMLLLGQTLSGQYQNTLLEMLDAVRQIMRCEVLQEPWKEREFRGMNEAEIRARSHDPKTFYDQDYFLPECTDWNRLLQLNRLRTLIRQTELAACRGIPDRLDLIRVLNRLSSLTWILMIQMKKEASHGSSY